jgi:outer membrane biosynthesis protein TonB
MKATGTLAGLALALAFPIAPAVSAPACPEVDSARVMLAKAAAAKNEQDLKQMPRNVPAPQPGPQPQPGAQAQPPGAQPKAGPQPQAKAGAQPAPNQPDQARGGQNKDAPAVETAPVPEDMKRAAILVKEADAACQAGQAAQAAEKAQAAMALMKH